MTRVAVLRDPTVPASASCAPSRPRRHHLGCELRPIDVRDAGEIERAITAFAQAPNGGLIVLERLRSAHRELIIMLAARHRLPAIYSNRSSSSGGLISYGPDCSTSIGARPATLIVSLRARSPPTCRCRRRPSTSWSSTSRPPRRLALTCHRRCSPAPTR